MKKLLLLFALCAATIAHADNLKEGVDFVYLTKADIQEMGPVILSYFGDDTEKVLVPVTNDELKPAESATYSGDLEHSNFLVKLTGDETLEFNHVKLSLNKPARGGYGEYNLLAVCIGAGCGKIFATVFIRENGEFKYNMPLVFKRVSNGKYLRALQDPKLVPEKTSEEEESFNIPPQVKAQNLLEAGVAEHGEEILKTIRERLKKSDAVYSGLFFAGMDTSYIRTEFKMTEQGLDFSIGAHYLKNRPSFDLHGVLGNETVVLTNKNSETEAYTTLEAIPVSGTDLILFLFDQTGFPSLLPHETRGMSALTCAIVDENGATFEACGLVPSSVVLGTLALEGKVDGPIYVMDGKILGPLEAK